jgi:hypothetical protein
MPNPRPSFAEEVRAPPSARAPSAPDVVAGVVSVAIVAYVAVRAATLAITIDEALTWTWHATGTWQDIVLLRTPGEPDNNHVLFTLLAKLAVACFGLTEFALRLPTLLGLALFLGGVNAILRRTVPGWMQVLGVCALGLNPYLVDYFSIARGYGLGLGLATAGVAALLAAMADAPHRVHTGAARAAFLLFTLAALANLTFVLVLVVAAVVLWTPFLVRGRARATWRALWPASGGAWVVVVGTALLQGYLLRPLVVVRRAGLFAVGGTRGFWPDTAGSLVEGTIHAGPWPDETRVLLYAWIAATLLLAPAVLWSLRRRDRRAFAAVAVVFAMTLLVAAGSVLQHALFGVAFLEGRRGLSLLVLFTLSALALARLPRTAPRLLRMAALAASVAVPALLAVRGLLAMNTAFVLDWKMDAAGRDMMLATRAWIAEQPRAAPVRLRVFWPLAPSGEFYRHAFGLEASLQPLRLDDRPGFDGPADLYYVLRRDAPAVARFGVAPLRSFGVADTVLLQRTGDARVDDAGAVNPATAR